MHTFKNITLAWWQVGIIKVTLLAGGILVAKYWPVVTEWSTLWWAVFAVGAVYSASLRFKSY